MPQHIKRSGFLFTFTDSYIGVAPEAAVTAWFEGIESASEIDGYNKTVGEAAVVYWRWTNKVNGRVLVAACTERTV